MSSSKRRLLVAGLAGLAGTTLAGLGGCGFELRRPPRLSFSSITLTGFGERSPLAAELRKQLAQQVRVLQPPASVDVVLAAQVRELQLRVKFNFRAQTPGGRELIPRAELLLSRDLSYTETAALAKEQEEAELYREMQNDVVRQVLRRLAAVQV